ncbi:MAG TPA: AmmeMemoRadiSam system protein B [Bacteroides sp.]|nr:AmmeMemoRadiSam system protein B [Bacteroides sp.]
MYKKSPAFVILLCLYLPFAAQLEAQELPPAVDRQPAVAGSFYPADREALLANLRQLFEEAPVVELKGKVQQLLVPHAGYPYSGLVAAAGYKSIPGDATYKNIFIIASSHREQYQGASVYSVGNYLTPLGEARVNREIATALIEGNKNIFYYERAHNREHSIEIQVPFIQYHFEEPPPLVPIVIGSSSLSVARDLALALLPYFNEENLFIISSDFSHYPSYRDARYIDELTGQSILKNDPEHFYNTIKKNSSSSIPNLVTPCCSWNAILTLLYMSQRRNDIQMTPILYRNSGDASIGDRDRVVGYWAIAGYRTEQAEDAFILEESGKEKLVEIARTTLESYIRYREIPEVDPSQLPESLKRTAGAFVSLYTGDRLRGCIGSFFSSIPLYQLIQEMTVASATRDQRFAPVEPSELEYIQIEISVLSPLQKIRGIEEFQLGKHGIYMTKNGRSGTFLPQVASGRDWTAETFFGHCARDKAGIGWDGWKEADLYVYEAVVFGEEHIK